MGGGSGSQPIHSRQLRALNTPDPGARLPFVVTTDPNRRPYASLFADLQ
jgi:hypothetical protein